MSRARITPRLIVKITVLLVLPVGHVLLRRRRARISRRALSCYAAGTAPRRSRACPRNQTILFPLARHSAHLSIRAPVRGRSITRRRDAVFNLAPLAQRIRTSTGSPRRSAPPPVAPDSFSAVEDIEEVDNETMMKRERRGEGEEAGKRKTGRAPRFVYARVLANGNARAEVNRAASYRGFLADGGVQSTSPASVGAVRALRWIFPPVYL